MLCMGAAMFAVLVGKMSALSQAMNEEESVSAACRRIGFASWPRHVLTLGTGECRAGGHQAP